MFQTKPKLLSDVIKRDNNNLNFVRLWLAFSVIIGHIPVFISAPAPHSLLNKLFPFTYCGNIAVVTFFFFSGLLVTNSLFEKKDIKQYLFSRFLRIYPVLLLVVVAGAGICYYFSELTLSEYIRAASKYVKHNFFVGYYEYIESQIPTVSFIRENYPLDGQFSKTINGSLWILPYEIRLYIALLGLFLLYQCLQNYNKIIISLILCVGILSPQLFTQQLLGGDNQETIYLIPCFSFGALMALYKDKIYFSWKFPLSLFLIGFILKKHQISHLFMFFGLNLTCLWISTLSWIKKIPVKIDISYGVYVWGWLIQQIVQYYCYEDVNYYSYALICIAITCIISLISYYLVEKPCLKLKKYLERIERCS